ncbi:MULTISPECIES: hypothetical protein [unclassified Nocardioides]|uniref:hypothetical protein n=1 Tax=unclassified Nocardioides TaxID=2615069 RepID=UPI0030142EF9
MSAAARTASAGGAVLATATRAVAALRPARKPLHPRGVVRAGRVFRSGSIEPTGVAWIDQVGEDDVDVRLSRAIGLPAALPDIHGLAIRVHAADGDADLLLASTGFGRLTRFMLTASRSPLRRPLTTLLPYDTDSGPVLLGAEAIGADTYSISWSRPAGDWVTFGVLRLAGPLDDGTTPSFDPVRRQVPGLRQYPSVTRLREPAYLRARRSRSADARPTSQENAHEH